MWKVLFASSLVIGFAYTNEPKICCPEGTAVLRGKNACWDPKLNATTPISVLNCTRKWKPPKFSINSNGELVIKIYNNEDVKIEPEEFCKANVTTIKDFDLKNVTEGVVACVYEKTNTAEYIDIKGYGMIVSCVFLVLTAIIYAALPPLRDLQGRSIISFCITLACGLSLLAISLLTTYENMILCGIKGFLTYFFLLSAFFWTNAIAIQILLSIRRPSGTSYDWKEFSLYAAYAWGSPALLTLIMALVNFLPGNHSKPGIGLMTCWFYNIKYQWYYMYSVMSILVIANIGIFVYTSISLWRNTFHTTHLKALRYKFMLTVRLVVVLGVTWIFEMIGSLVQYNIVWFVIDLINLLQGVFIFLVLVVFRRRVLKAMYKRGWLDCISGVVEKHLAKVDDDEHEIEHTRDVPLDDK